MNARRFAGIAAGLTLLSVAGAACSDDESVFNAEVGECVESISDLTGNISELPESDCTEEHEGEIFFLFEHEGDDDDFPGESALQDEAGEECTGDAFEDYMGVSYQETTIDIALISPSSQSWGQGDRETICVAAVPGETVDESFEGNGEDFPLESGSDDSDDSDDSGGSSGSGEDTSLDDFADDVEDCEGGDLAACDQLYLETPVGSEAEAVGASCGGQSDTPLNGSCESELG